MAPSTPSDPATKQALFFGREAALASTPTGRTTPKLPLLAREPSFEPATLLMLSDDVLAHVCEMASHLPSALQARLACKRMNEIVKPLTVREKEKRALRWSSESTLGHVVTSAGLTLTRLGGRWTHAWAMGNPLPSSGRVSWRTRIDRCANNEGVMCIGVCDDDGKHAYGLAPFSGQLSCLSRAKVGGEVTANSCAPAPHAACTFTKQLMQSPPNLKGRAHGAIVEFTVDADLGTVHVRVNRGPAVCAIAGLPRGVVLRPWAKLFDVGDRVSCSPFWSASA